MATEAAPTTYEELEKLVRCARACFHAAAAAAAVSLPPAEPEPAISDVLTPQQLANDGKVKVAGIDVDGVLRGKVMHKDKFLSIAKSQSRAFGFCRSVVPSLLCPAIMLILCPFSSL
jgi:hypothetical protein